jgi:hypothetical protein
MGWRLNFPPSLQEVHHSSQSKRLQQLVPDASSDDEPQPLDVVADQLATWQQEGGEDSDRLVNLMKEQVIMARAYTMLAQQGGDPQLARQLRAKRKELQKMLGEATGESGQVCGRADVVREWRRLLASLRLGNEVGFYELIQSRSEESAEKDEVAAERW